MLVFLLKVQYASRHVPKSLNYKNYTDEKLEEALKEIRHKKLTYRRAVEKYHICIQKQFSE